MMTYHTFTTVVGYTSEGRIKSYSLSGRWKPEAIERHARRAGLVGKVAASHNTGDLSGRGRGGTDREFEIVIN